MWFSGAFSILVTVPGIKALLLALPDIIVEVAGLCTSD